MMWKKLTIIGIAIIMITQLIIIINAEPYEFVGPMPKETTEWLENCQLTKTGNQYNKIIGKTMHANDTDGKCKTIEQAQSLKNSPIKCEVLSDGIHLVECLDYNLTAVKLNLQIKDKIQEKSIPLKVFKRIVNITIDNKTGELIETITYEEKSSTNLIYNDLLTDKKEYEEWIQLNFGEFAKFGENSTTIQLVDNVTENLEDVYGATLGAQGATIDAVTWIKFNISSVPASQNITDSQFCVNVYFSGAGWDDDVYFANVNNQTWVETDTAATLNSLPISDVETDSSFAASTGWDCINVTTQVNVDYETNDYSSLKLWDPDQNQTAPTITSSASHLQIGELYNFGCSNCYIFFRSKEYSNVSQRPYLNITYVSAAADVAAPILSYINATAITNQSARIDSLGDENYNLSINYGTTLGLGTYATNISFANPHNYTLLGLINNTVYYYNLTVCDSSNNCALNGTYTFTTPNSSIDSCTYDVGDWTVDCTDACKLNDNTDLGGNNILFTGSGNVHVNAAITSVPQYEVANQCILTINKATGGYIG